MNINMNKKVLTGIAAGLLTTAAFLIVGIGAYRAGQRSDRTVEVVGELATNGEGSGGTLLVQTDSWHGPGPGFLLFPLIVIGVLVLFASRRRGWHGPHRYGDEELHQWHRRQHGDEPATPTT
ncbi:MAG: hypothetical protein M3337_04085 [Actinomycetota bacterium]|nr:hypothetical protein [Actinomycetota bacterium]